MIEDFTYQTFADRPGETFRLRLDDDQVFDLVLASATDLSKNDWGTPPGHAARTPFSILFVGPGQVMFPQRIYQLEHDELGVFELFLVPVGRDARGVQYEAVFT